MTFAQRAGVPREQPVDEPYVGASPSIAVARFWRRYATFTGRASLSEFWWWTMFSIAVSIVFVYLAFSAAPSPSALRSGSYSLSFEFEAVTTVASLWSLGILVPSLSLLWRRLHDGNRSGGWAFISLIPLVGPVWLLVLTMLPSRPGGERFDREQPTRDTPLP